MKVIFFIIEALFTTPRKNPVNINRNNEPIEYYILDIKFKL